MLNLTEIKRRLAEHPLARVGPGLITGAADDDPSGIATYSQAGAQFGLNMLWTMLVSYPLMAAVQSLCARIGRVTGQGLAINIKRAFPPWVLYLAVGLLLVANTINIGADVATMGNVLALMIGGNAHLLTVILGLVSLVLQVFVPYHSYVKFLKWLTLSLLSYAAVLFTVHVPWHQVAIRSIAPHLGFDAATATVVVGIFGTTISPYLFFWQCSEEVEELRAHHGGRALIRDAAAAPRELRRIRWDTWSGMLYSNVTAFFIILATAVTLHAAGVTNIETATQAASALRPLAGNFAFYLFAAGILGVGAIGVPVLAGSAAYAMAEAMNWPGGLESRAVDAKRFYAVISASMIIGLGLGFSPINPIKALFYSAVINGVVAVPLIALVVLLASRRSVLGKYTAGRSSRVLGWITAALMALAAVGMLIPG
ncbi:MAG TPA: divalent metal cation transporter [Steroidobacteraceae bacterium]|jgi:NRAMP (natural resistance-associated macrophage protein)-like metal ion transporter